MPCRSSSGEFSAWTTGAEGSAARESRRPRTAATVSPPPCTPRASSSRADGSVFATPNGPEPRQRRPTTLPFF
jgi:hypothetical protein